MRLSETLLSIILIIFLNQIFLPNGDASIHKYKKYIAKGVALGLAAVGHRRIPIPIPIPIPIKILKPPFLHPLPFPPIPVPVAHGGHGGFGGGFGGGGFGGGFGGGGFGGGFGGYG